MMVTMRPFIQQMDGLEKVASLYTSVAQLVRYAMIENAAQQTLYPLPENQAATHFLDAKQGSICSTYEHHGRNPERRQEERPEMIGLAFVVPICFGVVLIHVHVTTTRKVAVQESDAETNFL